MVFRAEEFLQCYSITSENNLTCVSILKAAMTIKELYNKVYSTNETKTPEVFVQLYEKNKDIIDNQDTTDDDSYEAVMRLTADYAHHLVIKESYKKALPYLEKAIDLFENFKGFDLSKMNKVSFYNILRFDRGRAYYYLKCYSKSNSDFFWLVTHNPDNDSYKNWLENIRLRKLNVLNSVLWYILAVLLILEIFIDKITYKTIHTFLLILSSFLLLSILVLEAIKYIRKRKSHKCVN